MTGRRAEPILAYAVAATTSANQAPHVAHRPPEWRGGEIPRVIVASDREMATEEACKKFGIIGPERLCLIVRELPCRRVFPVRRG